MFNKAWLAVRTFFLVGVMLLTIGTADGFAQSRVRVVRDQSTIWNQSFITVAMHAKAGTVLEVVAHTGTWYEIVIPIDNGRRTLGFIADVNVEALDASGAVISEPPPQSRPAASPRTSSRAASVSSPASPGSGFRGVGHFGYGSFLAKQSFAAVLGEAAGQIRGPWYGVGVQFQSRSGVFVEGGVARFSQTGERVFVSNGTVFRLGVPDTFTVTPLTFTAGYRVPMRRIAPFVGGGLGQYFFSETTPFDDPSENAKQHATSYHALGGVEVPVASGVAVAAQAQYTRVPDALSGGAAAAFNEKDLGGLQFVAKVIFGR